MCFNCGKEEWEHKPFSISVKIDPYAPKGMMYLMDKKIFEAQECMNHKMNYSFENPYRKYRRGRNRCLMCGVKINERP